MDRPQEDGKKRKLFRRRLQGLSNLFDTTMFSPRTAKEKGQEFISKLDFYSCLGACIECGDEKCWKFLSTGIEREDCLLCGCHLNSHAGTLQLDEEKVDFGHLDSEFEEETQIPKAFFSGDCNVALKMSLSLPSLSNTFSKYLKAKNGSFMVDCVKDLLDFAKKFTFSIQRAEQVQQLEQLKEQFLQLENLATFLYYRYLGEGTPNRVEIDEGTLTTLKTRLIEREISKHTFGQCVASIVEKLAPQFPDFYKFLILSSPPPLENFPLLQKEAVNELLEHVHRWEIEFTRLSPRQLESLSDNKNLSKPRRLVPSGEGVCICCKESGYSLNPCEFCRKNTCERCLVKRKCHLCSGKDRCPIQVDSPVGTPREESPLPQALCQCCQEVMADIRLCEVCKRRSCGLCTIKRRCHLCSGRDQCPVRVGSARDRRPSLEPKHLAKEKKGLRRQSKPKIKRKRSMAKEEQFQDQISNLIISPVDADEKNEILKAKEEKFSRFGECTICGEECQKFVWGGMSTDECVICGCKPDAHTLLEIQENESATKDNPESPRIPGEYFVGDLEVALKLTLSMPTLRSAFSEHLKPRNENHVIECLVQLLDYTNDFRHSFSNFTKEEHEQNLEWLEAQAKALYNQYLADASPNLVTLPKETVEVVAFRLQEQEISHFLFDRCVVNIFQLLSFSFPDFYEALVLSFPPLTKGIPLFEEREIRNLLEHVSKWRESQLNSSKGDEKKIKEEKGQEEEEEEDKNKCSVIPSMTPLKEPERGQEEIVSPRKEINAIIGEKGKKKRRSKGSNKRKERKVSSRLENIKVHKEKQEKFSKLGSCVVCGEDECRKFIWGLATHTDECSICGCKPDEHVLEESDTNEETPSDLDSVELEGEVPSEFFSGEVGIALKVTLSIPALRDAFSVFLESSSSSSSESSCDTKQVVNGIKPVAINCLVGLLEFTDQYQVALQKPKEESEKELRRLESRAMVLYYQYLAEGSPHQLTLGKEAVDSVTLRLKEREISHFLFDKCVRDIFQSLTPLFPDFYETLILSFPPMVEGFPPLEDKVVQELLGHISKWRSALEIKREEEKIQKKVEEEKAKEEEGSGAVVGEKEKKDERRKRRMKIPSYLAKRRSKLKKHEADFEEKEKEEKEEKKVKEVKEEKENISFKLDTKQEKFFSRLGSCLKCGEEECRKFIWGVNLKNDECLVCGCRPNDHFLNEEDTDEETVSEFVSSLGEEVVDVIPEEFFSGDLGGALKLALSISAIRDAFSGYLRKREDSFAGGGSGERSSEMMILCLVGLLDYTQQFASSLQKDREEHEKDLRKLESRAMLIYYQYLAEGAVHQIVIDKEAVECVTLRLKEKEFSQFLFSECVRSIFQILTPVFPDFYEALVLSSPSIVEGFPLLEEKGVQELLGHVSQWRKSLSEKEMKDEKGEGGEKEKGEEGKKGVGKGEGGVKREKREKKKRESGMKKKERKENKKKEEREESTNDLCSCCSQKRKEEGLRMKECEECEKKICERCMIRRKCHLCSGRDRCPLVFGFAAQEERQKQEGGGQQKEDSNKKVICQCCREKMVDIRFCEVCERRSCGNCTFKRKCHLCSGRDQCPVREGFARDKRIEGREGEKEKLKEKEKEKEKERGSKILLKKKEKALLKMKSSYSKDSEKKKSKEIDRRKPKEIEKKKSKEVEKRKTKEGKEGREGGGKRKSKEKTRYGGCKECGEEECGRYVSSTVSSNCLICGCDSVQHLLL